MADGHDDLGQEGELEEVEEESLLDHFPNLASLEPVGPESTWEETMVSLLPSNVEKGVLANGLTYFVQENREPRARAELFLVVGFGSVVEEDHEQGIAHIIEHLGFSATKAYENHAIVKFLESIGAPFGACQNAYTAFDRTVYTLHVPTDKEGVIEESLTVLREFAYFTRISEEDLEKERKVVMEEWRESRSAQGRLAEQYFKELAKGCKYCERLPIGKEEVICGASAETLRSFYAKYYHPQRMAVIAVGDFEQGAVVSQIRQLFDIAPADISPLPRAAVAPERPWYDVPDSEGVSVASSTDPELSFAQGVVDCKRPRQPMKSLGDFRRRLTEELFHKALSSRLLRMVVEPQGQRVFFQVQTETGEPLPALNPANFSIAPLPGRMRPALASVARELERVKRLGFHEAEVMRAKRAFLAEYEQEYIERDQKPSEQFAEMYVELFLDERSAPGVTERAQVAVTVLPTISCEEVSAVAAQYDFTRNCVVKIATPPLSVKNPLYVGWSVFQACMNFSLPRMKADLPSSEEVAAILRGAADEELEQWPADEDDVDARLRIMFEAQSASLLSLTNACAPQQDPRHVTAPGVPRPLSRRTGSGDVVAAPASEDEVGSLGEELILQNGLRILLKRTDLFDDEVVLRARRWGGLSEHANAGFMGGGQIQYEARVAPMVAMMLGICGLSVESLQETLDGKRLDPNPPSLGPYTTQFDANASPADLEDLLTVVSLLFLCPVDPSSQSRSRLGLVRLGLLAARLAEYRDPDSAFQQRVLRCVTKDHPYYKPVSIWTLLRLSMKRASAIFNERSSTPREWTLVLCGKLPDTETLLPLLQKYLGAIPNPLADGQEAGKANQRRGDAEARKSITPISVSFPSHSVTDYVKIPMVEPKGSTVICYPIEMQTITSADIPESTEAELKEVFTVGLLVRMLETRLIETLRFNKGKVYGVSCGEEFSLESRQFGRGRRGTLTISFQCDPADADELIAVTKAELAKLRDGTAPFTEEDVSAVRERERREHEECTQRNDWWADLLLDIYFARCYTTGGGEEVGAAMSLWWRARSETLEGLDAARAEQAFKALLPQDVHSAVVTMRPRSAWSTPTVVGAACVLVAVAALVIGVWKR